MWSEIFKYIHGSTMDLHCNLNHFKWYLAQGSCNPGFHFDKTNFPHFHLQLQRKRNLEITVDVEGWCLYCLPQHLNWTFCAHNGLWDVGGKQIWAIRTPVFVSLPAYTFQVTKGTNFKLQRAPSLSFGLHQLSWIKPKDLEIYTNV